MYVASVGGQKFNYDAFKTEKKGRKRGCQLLSCFNFLRPDSDKLGVLIYTPSLKKEYLRYQT